MTKPAVLGIDVGSTTWKGVVLGEKKQVVASLLEPTEADMRSQSSRNIAQLQKEAGISTAPIGATGYGRRQVPDATRVITEITCHAKGAYQQLGSQGTLLDIGGQDTKAIRLNKDGAVSDFAMNDKCAAGTGRFLEIILARLNIDPATVESRISGTSAVPISSTCTVFAESEIISLIAQGSPLDGILHGVHLALADRVTALIRRLQPSPPFCMSGGVALNSAMVRLLSQQLEHPLRVLDNPQLIGAIGAALSVFPR